MQISQGLLNIATCARKFQYLYLDQLSVPISAEQQDRLDWGTRFHLLMQRHTLGLPLDGFETAAEPINAAEYQMLRSVDRLIQSSPDLFRSQPDSQRYSEHRRTLSYQGHILTVVYDLLILTPDRAQIIDWKTYPRPQSADRLQHHWQTQLYLYVLVETSQLPPEQVTMTYWFVHTDPTLTNSTLTNPDSANPDSANPDSQDSQRPQSLQFSYSTTWHQQIQQQLAALLEQVDRWTAAYTQGNSLPQSGKLSQQCDRCAFQQRCQPELDAQLALAHHDLREIPEIFT